MNYEKQLTFICDNCKKEENIFRAYEVSCGKIYYCEKCGDQHAEENNLYNY